MKITGFQVLVAEIPMRLAVQHSLAERRVARNVFVCASDDEGRLGWGETCPRPYVTGETVESAVRDLGELILPAWRDREYDSFESVRADLETAVDDLPRSRHAAFCACELAVLHLAAQAFECSVGDVLGPIRSEAVRYSGVVATDNPEQAATLAGKMAEFGIEDVKVKTGPSLDTNRALLEAVRNALGDKASLRIDANAAWDAPEALRQIEALLPFRIDGVEQPVPADDIKGMHAVTEAALVPVIADESACSKPDVERLAREQACHIVNIRVSKCGGLVNAGNIHRLALSQGLHCQLGAQVGESGILSAAGRQAATRLGELRWCEGSFGRLLLEDDIVEPDLTFGPGGMAPALHDPGLGVTVDFERLKPYVRESLAVPPA